MKTEQTENSKSGTLQLRRDPLEPFVLVPKVFFTRFEPTWRAILVYNALTYYSAYNTATCEYVTMKTMAKRVGIGWRTFLRGLEELKRKGVIAVRHRSRKNAKGDRVPLANLYELLDLQDTKGPPI